MTSSDRRCSVVAVPLPFFPVLIMLRENFRSNFVDAVSWLKAFTLTISRENSRRKFEGSIVCRPPNRTFSIVCHRPVVHLSGAGLAILFQIPVRLASRYPRQGILLDTKQALACGWETFTFAADTME